MNKKHIFIGLGLVVLAGVGFMIWKSKKESSESDKSNTKSPVTTTTKKLSVVKKVSSSAMPGFKENKVNFAEEVKVEIDPVKMVPDRSWLEKSWAEVI